MRADRADTLLRLQTVRDALAVEPLSLAEAAALASLSPFHFHRVFSEVFGETPHDFMTARRLERARALLLNSDLPINEIAFLTGFSGPAAFAAAFRKRTGWSPLEFREGARRYFAVTGWRTYRFIPACFGAAAKAQL